MLEGTVVDFDAKLTYQAFCRSAATLIVSHPAYDDSPSGFYQRFPTSQEMLETSGNIRKTQMCSHVLTFHVPRFSEKSHPSWLVGHVPLQCVWDDPGSVEGQGRQFQRAAQWAEGSGVCALEISCSPLVVRYPKWCIVECVLLWATMMGI